MCTTTCKHTTHTSRIAHICRHTQDDADATLWCAVRFRHECANRIIDQRNHAHINTLGQHKKETHTIKYAINQSIKTVSYLLFERHLEQRHHITTNNARAFKPASNACTHVQPSATTQMQLGGMTVSVTTTSNKVAHVRTHK